MDQVIDCLLLLGGNEGDRLARLRQGLAGLSALPGAVVAAVSRVYETAPVGPSRRPYLNAVARLGVSLSPMGLLVECKRLEAEAGRKPGQRWGSRPLDVDILDYGGVRLRNRWLTLPHPRIAERPFTLAPLREVKPGFKLPGGLTAARRLADLNPPPAIVKLYPHGL